VRELGPKIERQGHGAGQIVQQFFFPAVQTITIHLDEPVMAGTDDEFCVNVVYLLEDFLIIKPGIAHKSQRVLGKQGARDANRAVRYPWLRLSLSLGCLHPQAYCVGRSFSSSGITYG
jgi:hypothetical protein